MKAVKRLKLDKIFIILAVLIALTILCLASFSIEKFSKQTQPNASTGFKSEKTLTSSTSGYLDSSTVYKVTSNLTLNSAIAASGTAVIYVEPGCTLTVNSSTCNWAAIECTEGNTLIIVGGAGSKVYANGADAAPGSNGSNGQSGNIDTSDATNDYGGAGGRGGSGGQGASAGIGGYGGYGGTGGKGGSRVYYSGSGASVGVGNNGSAGSNGGMGTAMGTVYILGSVNVTATGGDVSSVGGAGGAKGELKTSGFISAAGGAGGGGGAGGYATSGIGAGGYGGGGGGGGAGGGFICLPMFGANVKLGGTGGAGGSAYVTATSGESADWDPLSFSITRSIGGTGGGSGSSVIGTKNHGTLYKQSTATVSGRTNGGTKSHNGQLSQIQYTATLKDGLNTSTTYATSDIWLGQYLNASVPTKTGYTFNGFWTSASGGTQYINSSGNAVRDWNLVGDTTLYAQWIAKEYLIDVNILNPNGIQDYVSGTMTYYNSRTGNTYTNMTDQPESLLCYGGQIKISNIQPANGMVLSGVTSKDGRGSITQSGDTYIYTLNYGGDTSNDFIDSINIQMDWASYQVSYFSNGGTGSMTSRHFKYTVPTKLDNNTFIKTGYTFMGWSDGSPVADNYDEAIQRSKVKYTNGGNLTLTEPAGKNLYAVWRNNKYYVRYNGNGTSDEPVTGTTNNTTHYYNITSNLATNGYNRVGFTFLGWSTNPNATSTAECITSATTLTTTDNATVNLYAIWERNTYKVTFNSDGGSGLVDPLYVQYNRNAMLPTCSFTKIGYLFNCWLGLGREYMVGATINSKGFVNYAKNIGGSNYEVVFTAKWIETWAATTNNSFEGGTGVKDDPYQIKTAEQLAFLSKMVQDGSTYENIYFEQIAPIILSGKIWMPIGGNNTTTAFGGTYNGRGFAIIGLETYKQTDINGKPLFSGVGLFGKTNGATLTNVYLTNATIVGKDNVGGLIGENYGKNLTLYGCFVKGNVTGSLNVGGLVGNDEVLTLRISNSGFAGSVNGGSIILGNANEAIVNNCYAEVTTNISFCGGGANINACVYSAGNNKFYYDDKLSENGYFSDWNTYNGKPLPSGLTWMGGVESGSFSPGGYIQLS